MKTGIVTLLGAGVKAPNTKMLTDADYRTGSAVTDDH